MKGYDHKRDKGFGVFYYNASDKLHRTDGPAAEFPDGSMSWWINGKHLTEEEFKRRTTRLGKALYL